MLHFANLLLTNPSKPHLAPVPFNALVTEGDFGLIVGPNIVQSLQLDQIGHREVKQGDGTNGRLMPYVGPLRVTWGQREAFTGAVHGSATIIGRRLADELGLTNAAPDPAKAQTLAAGASLANEYSADMIMMQEIISKEICQELCDFAESNNKHRGSVVSGTSSYVDTAVRDVHIVDDVSSLRPLFHNMLLDITTNHVEPFYGVEMESWEMPQLLLYRPGGKYEVHADADRWVNRPGGQGGWMRNMDRDISLLVYLNDGFTGGALNFPQQGLKITPSPGLVVAFPSSGKYRHGAEPTESGERLVMVTWGLVKGSPRLTHHTGGNRIAFDRPSK